MTHLVCNFDKEAESLRGLEKQPGGDVLAEVFGLGAGLHLKGLGGEAHLAPAGLSQGPGSPIPPWLHLLDTGPSH